MTARMTRSRVAEVIVTCARGQRRGSGYRVTTDAVLTAAHVVDGATSIEVRFEADLPDQWTAAVAAWWADPDSDLAVLTIQPHSDGEAVPPAEFGRLADTSAAVPVTAVGFPQWKLRADEDTAEYYRDSYHATGNVASLSNWREGTLEVALSAAPGTGAADGRSPWEGMSGAVLWSGSRIIGVISRHHPRDGVSTLAATPIEGALARLSPQRLDQLRLLLPIPDAAELPVVVPGRDGDSGVTIDVCPYPTGMAAFSQEQAEWFFGRETLTAQLLGRLDDRLTRGGGPLIVTAPSGAGKSSLLQAGLLAKLADGALPGSRHWTRIAITPTDSPLEVLAAALAKVTGEAPSEVSQQLLPNPGRFAARLSEIVRRRDPDARVVLVIDQLEELFTLCAYPGERAYFLHLISRLAKPGSVVLAIYGVRADFYAECANHAPLRAALQDGQLVVGPMSPDELRDAISKPADHAGFRIESGLVDVLLRDLGATGATADSEYNAGRLPLLAHALRATWRQRDGDRLTLDGYRTTGGIEKAVETTADGVLNTLNVAERETARKLFLRLVKIGEDTDDTRRRAERAELIREAADPQQARKVLDAFTRQRLLTQYQDTVEITHEALLRAWPTLRRWINEGRSVNLLRQELHDGAEKWDHHKRDSGLLFRGSQLTRARDHLDRDDLSPLGQEFLAKSLQRRRIGAGFFSAVALFMVVAVVTVLLQGITAAGERDEAVFNQVLAQADRLQAGDPSLAAQLNLAAYRMKPDDPTTYTRLINTQNTPLSTPLPGPLVFQRDIAYSRDGKVLARAYNEGKVALWDVGDSRRPTPLVEMDAHAADVFSVAFSPKADVLATGADDGTVRLWNASDPARPESYGTPAERHGDTVFDLKFSPDGRFLASASEDSSVQLWDVADPANPKTLGKLRTSHQGVWSVAFSPDNPLLATAGNDGAVRLWNIADPANPVPLEHPVTQAGSGMWRVAFSAAGVLATASSDGQIQLWYVENPSAPQALGELPVADDGGVWAIAFSGGGEWLAVAGFDGTIQLWNVLDPGAPIQFGQPISGHSATVWSLEFSPAGVRFASASTDGGARTWELPSTLWGFSDPVGQLAFSPKGDVLAVARGARVSLLQTNVEPSGLIRTVNMAQGTTATTLAFSPKGDTLAVGRSDGAVDLLNVADPAEPTSRFAYFAHQSAVRSLTFDRGGGILASAGDDRRVVLWNASEPDSPKSFSTLPRGAVSPTSLAFSSTGVLAIGNDDTTVERWDISRPTFPVQQGNPVPGHNGNVNSVAFSENGDMLASAGADFKVRVWLDPSPNAITLGPQLSGHSDNVNAVALSTTDLSPTGSTLASASSDDTVRLWDIGDPASPKTLGEPLTGHLGDVTSVVFSPDGTMLATGSRDQTIRLWPLDVNRAIDRICRASTGNLNPGTWAKFVSAQRSFADPCAAGA